MGSSCSTRFAPWALGGSVGGSRVFLVDVSFGGTSPKFFSFEEFIVLFYSLGSHCTVVKVSKNILKKTFSPNEFILQAGRVEPLFGAESFFYVLPSMGHGFFVLALIQGSGM